MGMLHRLELLFLVVVVVSVTPSVFAARKENPADLAKRTNSIAAAEHVSISIESRLSFGAHTGIQEEDHLISAQGNTKRKYRETFRGRRVYDTGIGIEESGVRNSIVGGEVYLGLEEDLAQTFDCQLSKDEALKITLDHFRFRRRGLVVENEVFENLIFIDDNNKAHSAMSVLCLVIAANNSISRPQTFIDQCSKEVLDSFDRIGFATVPTLEDACATDPPPDIDCDVKGKAGNPKRPLDIGTSPVCLTPMRRSRNKVTCYLENEFIKVVDLETRRDDSKTEVVQFPCAEGYNDARHGGFSPVFDAFYFGTKSALMYRDWYSYAPLSNPVPYAKAHYGNTYDNAYWDGTSMVFGDGDGRRTYPWTGLDTVAHELGHGVVEETSNLVYRNQAGGINEAFCDMVGEAAEVYTFGYSDWVIGDEIFVRRGKVLRYFDDPTKDGSSIKHVDDYRSGTDVHSSSGIYNHVFYLVGQQIGIRATFHCFLIATRLYWRERTNFEDGACGTLRGAYDAGYDMDVFVEAFKAVGITLRNCPDLSGLVTAELRSGVVQENLSVSRQRNPIFKITVPHGKGKVTVSGSAGLEIALSESCNRNASLLEYGSGSVSVNVTEGKTVYARFYSNSLDDDSGIRDGAAFVSFS